MVTGVSVLSAIAASVLMTATAPPRAVVAPPSLAETAPAEEDLVLQMLAGRSVLADGLPAISRDGAVFLPLGELSRALDFAIRVEQSRAQGWVISTERRFDLDLQTGKLQVGAKTIAVEPTAAFARSDDIYVRSDVLEQWLPVRLTLNRKVEALEVAGTEQLPFEARLEREQRGRRLGGRASELVLPYEKTPYRLFSPPAFDIDALLASGPSKPSHYQARVSGDLAFMTARLFVIGDAHKDVSSVRFDLSRFSSTGIGPLKVRELDFGDVYTPALPNGERSTSGRGFAFSNLAPGDASANGRIDFRGELRDGWQAELYQNGLLVGSQTQPVNGQYLFQNILLQHGRNRFRIVLYGPHGETQVVERTEDSAVSLRPGQIRYSFGLISADKPLFDAGAGDPLALSAVQERGKLQAAGFLEYGLGGGMSASVHVGQRPTGTHEVTLAGAGLQGSFAGASLRFDATRASDGSAAGTLSMLGEAFGVNYALERSQYSGGFRDDSRNLQNDPLSSATTLRANVLLSAYGLSAPVSFDLQDRHRQAGGDDITGAVRTSVGYGNLLFSGGLLYQSSATPGAGSRSFIVETGVGGQVFGGLGRALMDYAISPTGEFRDVNVSWDRYLGNAMSFRAEYDKALTDTRSTRIQAALTRHFQRFDVTASGGYDSSQHGAVFGLRLSTSLGWTGHGYVPAPPGLASGGAAAVEVYQDLNSNGKKDPGEPGLAGVAVVGGGDYQVKTDASGWAYTRSLGQGHRTAVAIDPGTIEDPSLRPDRTGATIEPRPGRRHMIRIGVVRTADVESSVVIAGPPDRSVSNVEVELAAEDGRIGASARSDFDGGLLFQGVPPGRWTVRVKPEQAQALGLTLLDAPVVTVSPEKDLITLPTLKLRKTPLGGGGGAAASLEQGRFVLRGVKLQRGKIRPPGRIDRLWRPLIGRTTSLPDLRRLAAEIEGAYSKAGYPFIAAVIPPQTVDGGMVTIRIVEGRVSELTVLGRDVTARRQASAVFNSLVDREPLSVATVEESYEAAKAVPGLAVSGSIRKGTKPGGIELVVQAQRVGSDVYANVNNFYPKAVGPWGVLVGGDYNGGSDFGDRVSVQAYSAANYDAQHLLRLSYSRGVTPWGTTVAAAYVIARAHPMGSFSALNLATRVDSGSLEIDQPLIHRATFSATAAARLESTDQTSAVFTNVGLSTDRLRIASLRLDGAYRWFGIEGGFGLEGRKGLAFAGASRPSSTMLSRPEADPQAFEVKANFSAARALPFGLSIRWRVEGQWSDASLPAPEEYTVGALTIGRGYEAGAFYGDEAVASALELHGPSWRVLGPISVEPYAFNDTVGVWNREAGAPNDRWIVSAGAGLKFTLLRGVQLNAVYAAPIDTGHGAPPPHVLVNLTAAVGDAAQGVQDAYRLLSRFRVGGGR